MTDPKPTPEDERRARVIFADERGTIPPSVLALELARVRAEASEPLVEALDLIEDLVHEGDYEVSPMTRNRAQAFVEKIRARGVQ